MIDDLDTIGSGNHGEGFIFFGQRHAGGRGGRSERRNAGNGFDLDFGHLLAHDAGEMAEGGEGRGIAFDQKDQIAALGEQFDGLHCGTRPGLGQDVGIAGHREDELDGIGGNRQPAAFDDGQRVGRFLGLLHRIQPARTGLQRAPGAAGDQVGIAGAERGTDQFSIGFHAVSL